MVRTGSGSSSFFTLTLKIRPYDPYFLTRFFSWGGKDVRTVRMVRLGLGPFAKKLPVGTLVPWVPRSGGSRRVLGHRGFFQFRGAKRN